MILQIYTIIHTLISLIALFTGFVLAACSSSSNEVADSPDAFAVADTDVDAPGTSPETPTGASISPLPSTAWARCNFSACS